ncbi:MAG: translation initiation factor IF-2 [Clostridia bacterium]|nr:translation initiation factor IF-2 [Clostridia bacterium]
MKKMKVEEIAKKLQVDVSVIVKKLNKLGYDVKNGSSEIDEVLGNKIIAKNQQTEEPHIIRRKVKVVTTDAKGNEVENITTKAGKNIQKTSIVHENRNNRPTYNKDGLGVVTGRNRNRNNMQNIIVTQNGKKVEPAKKEEPKQEVVVPKVVEQVKEQVVEKPKAIQETQNVNRQNNNFRNEGFKKYPERRNDNRGFQNRENKPYEGKKNFNGNGNGYNKNYNNNNNNNNGNNNFRKDKPNFAKRDYKDNSTYKVNRFIKESQMADTIQKDTRDYSLTLIDKKKYNEEKTPQETKRKEKNANVMREQNSRINFSKIKGMQVSEEGLMDLYDRGENRKSGGKRKKAKQELNTTKIIPLTEVTIPEILTVKDLAESIKKQASEVIKKLFSMGIMATINQELDFDTAFLVCSEFGINATKQVVVTEEDVLFDDSDDAEELLEARPPIVTIMGHVDHGKTSLLDKIRATNVALGESGGITQHIGAYKVKINGREITFLDTPGHEAFSEMRARGAQVTDIVVIVVAADDSVKPQTIEAIQHAKAADVSIIVAITKIDKEGANIDRVKQDLLEHDLVSEEWGGDTIFVPVSSKTGEGIESLLEMILLVADVKDLKSNPNKQAKGTVVEAKLDKTRGALTTVLVQRGTLNVGDTIVLGDIVGKVRSMTNDRGEKVKSAGPSTPVEILGLGVVPETGEVFYEVKDEKTAHKLIEKRKAQHRIDLIKKGSAVTLDDLFNQIKDGQLKNLDIVLRADVQGSAQAIKSSLEKLSNDEVRVRVIASNTGGITESDVTLASLSKAIIIGFNVRPDANVQAIADKKQVDIRLYSVIYDAIEDVEAAMKGMLKPTYREQICGTAEVRHIFKVSNVGTIAGSYVKSGKILRSASVRVIRDSVVVYEAKIDSLKREKDDVKEVAEGYECGIKLEKYNDIKEGDILECFELIEEART